MLKDLLILDEINEMCESEILLNRLRHPRILCILSFPESLGTGIIVKDIYVHFIVNTFLIRSE